MPEKVLLTVKVKHDIWFIFHRTFMMSVPIISFFALGLILLYKKWSWITPAYNISFIHSMTGIVTIALSFIQV